MSGVQIPREAVEAGARALISTTWDDVPKITQHILREHAMLVLNAAAPLIAAAELELFAATLTGEHDQDIFKLVGLSDRTIQAINAVTDETKKAITERVKQLRAQT